MIDIHAHILPGIDDGAEDMYDTLEMARMAAVQRSGQDHSDPALQYPGNVWELFRKRIY